MENYEINDETLAIIAKNNNSSLIYEDNENFIIKEVPNEIMEESCEYFGSTFTGRQIGTTKLIGITHKVPIIIEESKGIIFFPTASPRLDNCSWLSLNNIKSIKKLNNKKGCLITFKNGKNLNVNTSYNIINNQILRASKLQLEITLRKNQEILKKSKIIS
jgi:competence protein ComK